MQSKRDIRCRQTAGAARWVSVLLNLFNIGRFITKITKRICPFVLYFSRFVTRVAQRRHVLDLAVLFYTHLAEVTTWLESLRRHLLEDLNFTSGSPSLEDAQVQKANE